MAADRRKRGFTLIEMIVTLVVIAGVAAIVVPACLQWADRAREQRVIMEARLVKNALDAYVVELYAGKEDEDWVFDVYKAAGLIHEDHNPIHKYLGDIGSEDAELKEIVFSLASNSVISFTYRSGGYEVIYNQGETKVTKITENLK